MTDSACRYESLRVASLRVASRRENLLLTSSSKSLPVGTHGSEEEIGK